MRPGLQASPVKWGQGRLCVTWSDNGATASGKLSSAKEFFVLCLPRLGLLPMATLCRKLRLREVKPLAWAFEFASGNGTTYQVPWMLPKWKRQHGNQLTTRWAKWNRQAAISQLGGRGSALPPTGHVALGKALHSPEP